jgi:integrase
MHEPAVSCTVIRARREVKRVQPRQTDFPAAMAVGREAEGPPQLRARQRPGDREGHQTHQMRRISLDPATVEMLIEHRQRYEDIARQISIEPTDRAFLFSHKPAHDRPYDPSAVTHRYSNICAKLGIDSHLHALRHYSATELLTAGVDLRTVAGRLGHGGGGATTLRVYAAWVGESDRRAVEILGGKFQRPRPLSS